MALRMLCKSVLYSVFRAVMVAAVFVLLFTNFILVTRSKVVPWACSLNTRTRGNGFYPQHARLNEYALNKIVRTHTLLHVLIARLDRLGGV